MDELEERIRRNIALHALLPKDVSEFTDDNLAAKLDTIELLELEIMADTRAMQALLKGDG
ncbi:hypothetical protein ACFKHW_38145 [Bradyrhizobium lupini]|uniref:hypothetical protein n=1 Tax=Rhizobium lupini TaxID=136996 RepID=UPI0036733B8C